MRAYCARRVFGVRTARDRVRPNKALRSLKGPREQAYLNSWRTGNQGGRDQEKFPVICKAEPLMAIAHRAQIVWARRAIFFVPFAYHDAPRYHSSTTPYSSTTIVRHGGIPQKHPLQDEPDYR